MKIALTAISLLWLTNISLGQRIKSGEYRYGLKLAFNNQTKRLTGYFENYTGWDEEAKRPKFSCIFYIDGFATKSQFRVLTYYPEYRSDDNITGEMEIVNASTVRIKLPGEHGGCWNVEHFADEPVLFDLEKKAEWTSIRYVVKDKTYFYAEKSDNMKKKAFLVKNDFVCIKKVENDWAYCTFYGKQITTGWIKIDDLNK